MNIINLLYKVRKYIFCLKLKKCGKGTNINFPVKFKGKENISIGKDSSINAFVHIWGHGGVEIGNRVMISSSVNIVSVTHDYMKENMRFAFPILKKVIIEDDVWIGANSVILPGVKIGKGAVVGACSLVNKNVPEYAVVTGAPAKFMIYRISKKIIKSCI